jgi:hypothetical protein
MKFTSVFILCHKTLGKASPKIILLLNSDFIVSQPKIKIWKHETNWSIFICLSAHNASATADVIRKMPKKTFWNLWNFELLLHLEKQLTLYMNTCLSHVLRKHENNWIFYIFTHKLCLILSFLCSTANNVTLAGLAM